ncbi:amino acid ABC transporter ATP-binding protein [Burkholderia stagnalis]|uniref:Amino acid ABC transporter ATP-binding protein n=1 Tax=Burkholderia stagnalis TaxID=1503054 RepID=A0A6L3N3I0_9BURK|nr:amino acid ABC transporter ATP-binding protein [Burkholderia stagnalis]KAB0640620.1 amino acid ABC transporter ATP-binding protein [Burkholderia stagnalis]VWB05594.1 amino acid ABC transporter ATP-binding protein [Burkholderia stagnalis]
MIEFLKVEKYFGNHRVLNIPRYVIAQGDVIVACGPSGSGKSTFIKTINKLEPIQRGQILIDGKNNEDYESRELATKAGIVFQEFELFPNYTALENVTLAQVKVLKRSHEEAMHNAIELLKRVGMTAHMDKLPGQLSGGQKQRIAIARSLAMNPEILLLDEPTASLDPENIKACLQLLGELAKAGTTMIVVTHELNFARKVSNRIAFFDKGEILEDRPTEEFFEAPATERARAFLDNLNY